MGIRSNFSLYIYIYIYIYTAEQNSKCFWPYFGGTAIISWAYRPLVFRVSEFKNKIVWLLCNVVYNTKLYFFLINFFFKTLN